MRASDSKLSMQWVMGEAPTLILPASLSVLAGAETVSAPGGAGHALQFRDHVLLKKDFKVWASRGWSYAAAGAVAVPGMRVCLMDACLVPVMKLNTRQHKLGKLMQLSKALWLCVRHQPPPLLVPARCVVAPAAAAAGLSHYTFHF